MSKKTFTVGKKDFVLSWYSGTGAGGQHRNRHMNSCRLKHIDTGIIKTGQSSREREANKKEALEAMGNDPRFRAYCQLKLSEIERGKTIEEEVEEMMNKDKLKIEVREDGKWKDQ